MHTTVFNDRIKINDCINVPEWVELVCDSAVDRVWLHALGN